MPGKSFPTDTILGYDLGITTKGDKASNTSVLSNLGLQLNYAPFSLPTFVIGKQNTTIVHGSCRRPGASGEDAFRIFDAWMSKTANDAIKRPASLFLTGDQIYADDVAIPLFEAVHKIASDIFGYVERIPSYFLASFSVDDFSWHTNEQVSFPGFSEGKGYSPLDKIIQEKNWSGRKKLTNLFTSNIGFTTDDGDAHLLSFPEYASMYLAVWNPVLCKAYGVDNGLVKELKDYHLSVQACQRVLANCATYMLCDDHDVTDDWNLDKAWEEKTKSHKMARRIISNALAAYWCFQAWGNDPYAFGESFKKAISEHLDSMWKNNGVPTTAIADNFENTLLGMHWSFMAQSNPKALCVDTRTRRTFPPGKTAVLSGPEVWPYLDSLRERYGFHKDDVLLLVLPTPFLPHRSMMYGQNKSYDYPSQRYEGDYELYGNNPSQRPDFINYLRNNFGPSAVVILSGDVHHGSIVSGEYGHGPSPVEIWSGKTDWKMPIVQVTSSPIKNINKNLVNKKWWTAWQTDAGNIAESIIPQWERQYATIKEGSYIAMRAQVQRLKGNLGRETYIFENHLCVVEMPSKPGGVVRSVFLGVKEGKLETAENSINLNDVFGGIELPPYIGPAIFLK